MRLMGLLLRFCFFTACQIPVLLAQEAFPAGGFEKLRRGNCSTCMDRIPVNGAHLPRLSLIKQRILQALGRGRENEPQQKHIAPTFLPKAFIAPKQSTTPAPELSNSEDPDVSRVNEIVTFSETIGSENGNAIIKFKHHNHQNSKDVEAVGASLLLYINRRRKVRKGGRGKKIILTVTDYNEISNSEEILTYLRTRVKKRRWKKLSLPLSVAQKFLNSGDRGLSLKVNCVGCGRLVQIVFLNSPDSQKSQKRKRDRERRKNKQSESARRKSKRRTRGQTNIATRPILVISTRSRRS